MKTDELSKLVFNDDLTGLYNRRWMFKFLSGQFGSAPGSDRPSDGSETLALLMMDLDSFKAINDTRGHMEGDRSLVRFSDILKRGFGGECLIVRYAGDEFSVLIPRVPKADALQMAERFRNMVEAESAGPSGLRTTVSIGLATVPEDARGAEDLIEKADRALYFSKHSGKNRVTDAAGIGGEVVFAQDLMKRFPCTELVGRKNEMETISALVESCGQGRNMFVLVRGTPGIGKTRLLGELVRLADKRDFSCLLERCSAEDSASAYRTLINLVNRYVTRTPGELDRLALHLSDDHVSVLGDSIEAFKELAATRRVQPSADSGNRREVLFEAIVSLLCTISAAKPLAILLDEFQNADSGTIEIFKQVLALSRGHVLICGAVADTPENDRTLAEGAIAGFLGTTSSTEKFTTLTVEALTADQVTQMITKIIPDRPPMPEFDVKIFSLSQGNPLYVEEILKSLIGGGLITRDREGWRFPACDKVSFPESLKKAINSRLASLDEETRNVITGAAVIGPNFRTDLLKTMQGRSESETLEIVDRAKRQGLIVGGQPLSDDELRFTSQHVRDVTYDVTDANVRATLHNQVGIAAEKLFKDELGKFAGSLAYHFRLGSNPDKTARFEQIANEESEKLFRADEIPKYREREHSILRSLIFDADRPLNPAAMEAVGPLLKNFMAAIKNVRMYPSGSRIIINSMDALGKSVRAAMSLTNLLTFAEGKDVLLVNTIPVTPKTAGVAVLDMLEMLKSHHIRSITFAAEHTPAELEAIVKGFSVPTEKCVSTPDYWSRYLGEQSVSNIIVSQKAYFVTESKSPEGAESGTQEREVQLDQEAMPAMRDVMRYLCASVENIRMYPEGSQLVTFALDLLVKSLSEIFKHARLFTLSEVEGRLLVSGAPATSQALGNPVNDLLDIMKLHGLTSFTIASGVTREELVCFLGRLAKQASEETAQTEYWDRLFKAGHVTHVGVGRTLYVAVGTRRIKRENNQAPGQDTVPEQKKIHEEDRMPEQDDAGGAECAAAPIVARASEEALRLAAEKATAAFEDLLTDESRNNTLSLIETLVLDGRAEQAAAVLGRIAQGLLNPQDGTRTRCGDFVAGMFEKASPAARSLIVDSSTPWVVDALRAETVPSVHARCADVARTFVENLLERQAIEPSGRVIWAIFKQREKDQAFSEELRQNGAAVLKNIAESSGMRRVFAAVASPDQKLRENALNLVAGLGAAVAPRLARLIKESDEEDVRRFAAAMLRETSPQTAKDLLNDLAPFASAVESRRIAGVIEQLSGAVEIEVQAALRHSDESVRREGLNVVRRMDPDKAVRVMMQALGDDDNNLVLSALAYFGEQKRKDCVAVVMKLVEKGHDERIRKEACLVLGKIGDEKALPLLARIVDYRPGATKIFGLGGAYTEDMRAAAAWALGSFHGNEAVRTVLERAAQDKSAAVRSAAKLSLRP